MANIKITELNEISSIDNTDVLPIVDVSANETKKITKASLVNDVYSTNEIKTNKVWVDNKPIYRKTIAITEFPVYNQTWGGYQKEYSTGITNIETPINMYGVYYNTNNNVSAIFSINNSYPSSWGADRTINTRLSQDGSKITIRCAEDLRYDGSYRYQGYVTLEYTKTS